MLCKSVLYGGLGVYAKRAGSVVYCFPGGSIWCIEDYVYCRVETFGYAITVYLAILSGMLVSHSRAT